MCRIFAHQMDSKFAKFPIVFSFFVTLCLLCIRNFAKKCFASMLRVGGRGAGGHVIDPRDFVKEAKSMPFNDSLLCTACPSQIFKPSPVSWCWFHFLLRSTCSCSTHYRKAVEGLGTLQCNEMDYLFTILYQIGLFSSICILHGLVIFRWLCFLLISWSSANGN